MGSWNCPWLVESARAPSSTAPVRSERGGFWIPIQKAAGIALKYVSYSLNSLKGVYMGDYIRDYYRGY